MRISPSAPALTFVLIFILMVSFLEKWIKADCGENRRPLSQVGESPWILLANFFLSALSSDWPGAGVGRSPYLRGVLGHGPTPKHANFLTFNTAPQLQSTYALRI